MTRTDLVYTLVGVIAALLGLAIGAVLVIVEVRDRQSRAALRRAIDCVEAEVMAGKVTTLEDVLRRIVEEAGKPRPIRGQGH